MSILKMKKNQPRGLGILIPLLQADPDDIDLRQEVADVIDEIETYDQKLYSLQAIGEISYDYNPDRYGCFLQTRKIINVDPYDQYANIQAENWRFNLQNYYFIDLMQIVSGFPMALLGQFFDSEISLYDYNDLLIYCSNQIYYLQEYSNWSEEKVSLNLELGFHLFSLEIFQAMIPPCDPLFFIHEQAVAEHGLDSVRGITDYQTEELFRDSYHAKCPNCGSYSWSEEETFIFECPDCLEEFTPGLLGFIKERFRILDIDHNLIEDDIFEQLISILSDNESITEDQKNHLLGLLGLEKSDKIIFEIAQALEPENTKKQKSAALVIIDFALERLNHGAKT